MFDRDRREERIWSRISTGIGERLGQAFGWWRGEIGKSQREGLPLRLCRTDPLGIVQYRVLFY